MLDRPRGQPGVDLPVQRQPLALRPILLDARQLVDVAGSQQARRQAARPAVLAAADVQRHPPGGQPVAALIARVGAQVGVGVEAVELAAPGDVETVDSQSDGLACLPAHQPAQRGVAIAVTVAAAAHGIDPFRLLVSHRARHADVAAHQRSRCERPSEPERAGFRAHACPVLAQRVAVDRDHAADGLRSPQRRLRPAHHGDPPGDIGVQQLKARGVARGGVVGADAVDEQQGVVGLGAADAYFGERS